MAVHCNYTMVLAKDQVLDWEAELTVVDQGQVRTQLRVHAAPQQPRSLRHLATMHLVYLFLAVCIKCRELTATARVQFSLNN